MAKQGAKFEFHGSYTDKQKAMDKEREVKGFIREHKVAGRVRYYVLTRKE